MEKQVSIQRNFIMNAILNASAFIFPLIIFPYVSRILLPVGTGKVAFAQSVISYFSMVAMLGIPTYGIRACARVRDDKEKLSKTVHEIFFINLIMTIVVYAALMVSVFAVERFAAERTLLLIVSITIIFNCIGMEWLYRALEQYSYITIRSILFKLLSLVLVFLFIHQKEDYLFYGFTIIFAETGSNILNFINARKHISFRRIGNYNLRQHLKPTFIFFAMTVATTIYTNLDTVMLGFMRGDEQVGYYNAAVRVKAIVVSLVTSIGTVLLPRVSYYVEKKMNDEFKKVTAKAFNLVVLMALPFVLYFIFFAKEAVIFLSGKAYLPAVVPMQVIMPTVLLIGMTNIMGIQILIPLGREKMVLLSEIAGAITDLILNALLIPGYGCTGAAIGTLAAELVVLIVQVVVLRKFVYQIIRDVKILRILFACLAAVVGVGVAAWIPFSYNFLRLIWTAAVFFCIYGLMLLLLKEPLARDALRQIKGKIMRQ